MIKNSDLYNNTLYSIVPSYSKGTTITPEDQSISPNKVFLWSSYRDVKLFSDRGNATILKVKIPEDIKYKHLIPVSSGIYSLPYISGEWILPDIEFSTYE